VDVVIPAGRILHARPAAALARMAGEYRSVITLENLTNGRGPVNARSVVSLLSLGATAGTCVRVLAEGDDAAAATAALSRALVQLLEAEALV